MITYLMTYEEMYDHLARDLKKVEYRKKYFLPKTIKEFRKARTFPVWQWYEYKIPYTNHKYVVFFGADNPSCIKKPKLDFFVEIFFDGQRFVIKWRTDGYRHTPNSPTMLIRQIHSYASHFLHRYNERFLKGDSLSTNDIACRYLSRNNIAMPNEINESINKHIEEYGEVAKQCFRVKDGVCFTRTDFEGKFHRDEEQDKERVDAMVLVYTTFIPESKMTNEQRTAIQKEHWKKWTESFMGFMKESKNGVLTLKLEP